MRQQPKTITKGHSLVLLHACYYHEFTTMEASFSQLHLSHGFAQVSSAELSLQKGIQSSISLNKQVQSVNLDALKQCIITHQSLFEDALEGNIETYFSDAASVLELLLRIFSWWTNKTTDYESLKRSTQKALFFEEIRQQDFLKCLYQLAKAKEDFLIEGEVLVAGTSHQASIPVCFLEVLQLEFEDETKLNFFNVRNHKIAQSDGRTEGVISIVPIPLSMNPLNKKTDG